MVVETERKRRMAKNLDKTFELLKTALELKVAYLKKKNPDKTEAQLVHKIHWDFIKAKKRKWESKKV